MKSVDHYTYKEQQINSQASIDAYRNSKDGSLQVAYTQPLGNKDEETQTCHVKIDVFVDTNAVLQAHNDPYGVTTIVHEGVHTENRIAGMLPEENKGLDQQGIPESIGEGVSLEQPDICEAGAANIVERMLDD
jgi:hypothetical protein